MADDTSAHAPARDWRLVVLAGGAGFTVSFALFHFVLPVGAWVVSGPGMPPSSLFLSAMVAFLPWR